MRFHGISMGFLKIMGAFRGVPVTRTRPSRLHIRILAVYRV